MGKTALIASGLGISPFGVINLDTTDISSAAIGSLLDENPNGTWTLNVTDGSWLFDGRDARLDSWSLEITELEPFGISDDDGSYFVAGIDPSTYQVRQVAARGCVETFPGTSIYSEAFSRGQTISGIDFGVSPPGEIHGRLWRDVNKNGVWDAGEQALEGFTVFIDDNNNHNLDAGEEYQITDASGRYAFEDLAPGQYTITVADKAGWQATYPNISATQTLNLAVGQNVAGVDFGFVPPGSVYGTIYNDSNNNGQFDPGENPISGWMVYIDYNGNGTYDYGEPLAYSDNNGYYCINDIPANSSVSVREVCQVGWKPSNPAGGQTTIFVGADSANSANFGNSENPLTIFVTAQYNSPDPAADGSVEHPFASITQGVNTVQDGGTVIIGPGDYMENVEVRRSNITIIGAGAKSTIIYPGNSGSTMLLNGNNITLRGLRINDNPLLDNTQYIGVEIDQCDNITLQRCAIVGQTSYGVFIYGSSESTPSIKFVNCTISGNQGDHQIQVQPSDITDNGYFYIYPNITFINTIVAGGSEPFYCYGNDNACGGQVNMITSWVNKGDPGFMPGKCTILGPNSPCIDAGTWIGDEDYDGELPWDDPLVPNTGSGKFTYQDIGVDEFVDRNLDGNPDADGLFVSGTQVNGGLSVHSYVNQVSITFSSVLTKYSMDNVTLKYPDGTYILLNTLPVQFDSVRSILTIDMSTLHLGTGIYEIDFPSADFMDYLGQMLGAGDAAFIAGACSASFMVLEGDTDGDGQVTSYDLLAVKKCIGTRQGDVGYDANCDLNGDGIIDMSDLAIVRSNMGHSLLPPPSTQVDLDSNKVDDSGRLMYFTHDIGELQTYHIKVGNCGGSALTIGGIDIEGDGSGDFNYVWMGKTQGTTSGILQANEVADLAVTFTGSHLGDSNATLSFVHNAFNIPNPYSIALTGHVLIPGSLSWSAVGGSFWAQIGIEDDQMGIGDEQDGGGGEVSDGQWQTSNLYPLNDVSTGLMMGPTGNSVASFIQLWYLNDTLTSPEFKAAGCSTTNGADNTFSYSELNLNSLNFLLSGTGEEVYTLTVDKNVNDNDIMLAPFFPEDQGISDCSVQLNSVTLNLKPSSQEGIYTATFIGHPGDVLSLSGQLYTETNQKAEIAIKVLYPNQKNQILNSTFDDSDLDGWNYFFGSVDFVPSDNGMSLHTNDGAGIYYYFPTPLPEGTYELSFECMGSVDSIGIGYNWNWWFGQGGIGTGEQLDNGWSRYSIQFSDSVSSIQLYMEGWDPNVFIDNICLYSVEQQQQMQSRFIRLSSTPQNTLYGDINSDGLVDFGDLGQLASSWLKNDPTTDIAPSPNGDGIVNFRDFAEMAKNWMK